MGDNKIKSKILNMVRGSPKLIIYAAAAVLSVVLLIILREPSKPKEDIKGDISAVQNETPSEKSESYADDIQSQLEEILSSIRGVGSVQVMVTIDGTEEYIYTSDTDERDSQIESKTVIVGSKEALLKSVKNPQIKGVLVVCGGGENAKIKEQVVNAVSTVLDIPASKVYVTSHK